MTKTSTNIRKIRQMKGIKQQEIAGLLNKSQQFVSKIENGKTKIKSEDIEKMAKHLGVNKEEFETFDDKMVFNFTNNDKVESSGYIINYKLDSEIKEEINLLRDQNLLLREQIELQKETFTL